MIRTTLVLLAVLSGGLRPGSVDHALFESILRDNVTVDGWVDYKNIHDKHAADLERYLQQLAETDIAKVTSKNERVAFWINSYNAVCIRMILDNKIPASVPKSILFGKNIFREETYRIAGKVRSLDEIEHQILRKRFKDPRIHAALVCAASSCPRLRQKAYKGERIGTQLDDQAKGWIQRGKTKEGRRKNMLNRDTKTLYVSKIFDWFQEDFGGDEAGVLEFVKRFSSKSDREFLSKNRVRVRYLDYSWKLNSQ